MDEKETVKLIGEETVIFTIDEEDFEPPQQTKMSRLCTKLSSVFKKRKYVGVYN
jgi:hypothetical protein